MRVATFIRCVCFSAMLGSLFPADTAYAAGAFAREGCTSVPLALTVPSLNLALAKPVAHASRT